MLLVALAAVPVLLLVLVASRRVEARRLARLLRAQEAWAELLDREAGGPSPLRPRAIGRASGELQ